MTNCVNWRIIWECPSSEQPVWENLKICADIGFAFFSVEVYTLFKPCSIVSNIMLIRLVQDLRVRLGQTLEWKRNGYENILCTPVTRLQLLPKIVGIVTLETRVNHCNTLFLRFYLTRDVFRPSAAGP